MVRIQLENGYLDVKEGTVVPLNLGIADVRDVSERGGMFSKSIKLPGTKNNNILLDNYYDVNIEAGTFDIDAVTTCAIIQDGIPVVEDAVLQLVSVEKVQPTSEYEESVEYTVVVKDAQADFFTKINDLELTDLDFSDLDHTYSAANVQGTFNNTVTDGYMYPLLLTGGSGINLTDFHPAIYCKLYWDRIHSNAGFSYTWADITADKFDKCIIPHNAELPPQDYSDYLLDISKTSFTPTLNTTITSWTENQDNQSIFNNATGVLTSPFYLAGGQGMNLEVTIDADIELVNGTGANAYLVDMLSSITDESIIYVGYFRILVNGTQTASAQFTPTFDWAESDNPLPNGTTSLGNISQTVNVGISNITTSDAITFALDIELQYSNGSPSWLLWKDAASTSGTNVTITEQINVTSLDVTATFSTNSLSSGQAIQMNDFVPAKIKQKDFVKSVCMMWNLYIEQDPDNPNNLIYQTRDDYYDAGAEKDWSKKIAKERPQNLEFLPDLTKKRLLLTYKKDKDSYNQTYVDEVKEVYGQLEYIFTNEYVRDTDKKEVIFSPTPMTRSTFNAVVPAINATNPANNIRILIHNGTATCNSFNIYDYATSGQTGLTSYPQVSHFDDHINPTFDLNWGVCDYYYYEGFTLTNNNLYNLFWRRTVSQINSGKMLTAYFDLREDDIQKLALSDKIRINNSWWHINRIIDYDANSSALTKVELMSVDTEIDLNDFPIKIALPNPSPVPNTPSEEMLGQWVKDNNLNYSPGTTTVLGTGNVVAPDIKAVVIGDNMFITEDGYYINGERIDNLSNQSRTYTTINITSNYTADPDYDEYIRIDHSNVTVTLPDPKTYDGKQLVIKNWDNTNISVTTAASTIDGQTTINLIQYDSLTVYAEDGHWNII